MPEGFQHFRVPFWKRLKKVLGNHSARGAAIELARNKELTILNPWGLSASGMRHSNLGAESATLLAYPKKSRTFSKTLFSWGALSTGSTPSNSSNILRCSRVNFFGTWTFT